MRTKPQSAATTPPSSSASNRPVKRRKTLSDAIALPTDLLPSPTETSTGTPDNAGRSRQQLHIRSASLDAGPNTAGTDGYGNFQNSPTESYGTDGARSPDAYAVGDLTGGEMDIDSSNYTGEASTLTSPSRNSKVNISGAEKQITKRACNECRQQKLRCDVVQHPYADCSRCKRLKLECRIDSNFKRTVKRSKIAEMEKEVAHLRSLLGITSSTSSPTVPSRVQFSPTAQISQPLLEASASAISSFAAPQTASAGFNAFAPESANSDQDMQLTSLLTDMKNDRRGAPKPSVDTSPPKGSQTLEDVMLTKEEIDELFRVFFVCYHPFLPMLDPATPPSVYYSSSQLLFWVVISIASRRYPNGEPNLLIRLSRAVSKLVWSTLAAVPHNKYVVKALILLSTWPFPTSSTLTDPTYMLSGLAVSVAIQMGLHRPGYGKDYTKFANKAKVDNSEVSDRTTTWACCNISAQSVSTGLGLPPDTQYDWTISNALLHTAKYPLPTALRNLVLIQRFADTVTRSLSSNNNDPIGLLDREGRPAVITLLERRLDELEGELNPSLTPLHRIYLLSARLHLRSFHLFDSPTSSSASTNQIINLYGAAEALVSHIIKVEEDTANIIEYCPVYIYQMFTCAAFTMLKVLRSSYFNRYLNVESGIKGFNAALQALRNISVADNDLPARMADVLTQLWECNSLGADRGSATGGSVDGSVSAAVSIVDKEEGGEGGETLHAGWDLRIRSRMSVSVVYDSLWKWREQFRERSAILQAREEVGGATTASGDKFDPAQDPQSQPPQAQPAQPPPLAQPAAPQSQKQQLGVSLPQQQQQRHSFPVLSNAFQRPMTPLVPTDLINTLSTPATPPPIVARTQNPMLPIPTTGSNSETPSNASVTGGLDAVVDVAQIFGVPGMMGTSGAEAFDLTWVLDGFEFLPLPGDESDLAGIGPPGGGDAAGLFGIGI
ncbi:hypothetical protein DRE_07274 [Drechslerella stenobrocha 248]|uniref:Zn(2)-C6 fungal-type domain-containing protein n=1 Tax=Drechslerella stenobrocha 248 TaxID=1043628 RepID=W7I506_9PEZI|nr:hypothetical protein DRE_07274 [Drechslerella stenobrocha 248]